MRNISFAHIKGFHHRHFPDARHDFMTHHPDDFLTLVSNDIAAEAFDQHAAQAYIKNHPCTKQYEPSASGAKQAEHNSRRLSQHEKRQQRLQAMPKHFYVNDEYKTSLDSGDCIVFCCRRSIVSLPSCAALLACSPVWGLTRLLRRRHITVCIHISCVMQVW